MEVTPNGAASSTDAIALHYSVGVNSELEKMWNETIVPEVDDLSKLLLGGSEENHRIVYRRTQVRGTGLRRTVLSHYTGKQN